MSDDHPTVSLALVPVRGIRATDANMGHLEHRASIAFQLSFPDLEPLVAAQNGILHRDRLPFFRFVPVGPAPPANGDGHLRTAPGLVFDKHANAMPTLPLRKPLKNQGKPGLLCPSAPQECATYVTKTVTQPHMAHSCVTVSFVSYGISDPMRAVVDVIPLELSI